MKMKKVCLALIIIFNLCCFNANAKSLSEYKVELDYIEMLKPIVKEVNKNILQERTSVKKINLEDATDKEKALLEEKAKKYDVFTRLKGKIRYEYIKEKLLEKIDVISPSLLIAISGIETNWGRSRIVERANSLYKELSWDGTGLAPDASNADYKIKMFGTKTKSMEAFANKINSSLDFEAFRYSRQLSRYKGEPLQGRGAAHLLNLKSPLKNYVGILDYTITFYALYELDINAEYFSEE